MGHSLGVMAQEHRDADQKAAPLPPPARQVEYPAGAVVAVIDDLRRAWQAADAARPESASPPYVVEASEVLRQDEQRDQQLNLLDRVYLTLGQMVSDERSLETQYLDEARAGHHMVVASARDETQAEQLWMLFRSYGAHHGTYHGALSIRDLR